jgi:hypothetical protein
MLQLAPASGNTTDFFGAFEYYFPGQPFDTLECGEALLAKCENLAPGIYKTLHKGTPFYWLSQAAFLVHDYETAAFYIDAAVSEDLKINPANHSTPALLFFLINDTDDRQASLELVKVVRKRIEDAIFDYNKRPGTCSPALTFPEIRQFLLLPSILPANVALRTLATTFISFFLEWDHRSDLIKIRPEQGTAEPFFIHLFKGCVLFESLLKASKKAPKAKMLGGLLSELHADLGFTGKVNPIIGGFDFQTVVSGLSSDDNSIYTAVERTGRMRNTTGHNLGWGSIDPLAYNSLASYVASSCLHAIASLYR